MVEKTMQKLEDYPQTDEGALRLCAMFSRVWGGTVKETPLMDFEDAYAENGLSFVAPGTKEILKISRPGKPLYYSTQRDPFYMDFENSCLANHWDSSSTPHPTGVNRHENEKWAEMIQKPRGWR